MLNKLLFRCEGKPSFIVFTGFPGVNTPITVNFKLSVSLSLEMGSMSTVSSCELRQVNSSPQLDVVLMQTEDSVREQCRLCLRDKGNQ